jgi:fatty-acyl-CoA synthase
MKKASTISGREKLALVFPDSGSPILPWTVGRLLEGAAENGAEMEALADYAPERAQAPSWTYAQLLIDVRRLASFLATLFKRGDRVAMWGRNRAEWLIYELAAFEMGLVVVTLNPALRARELAYALGKSGAVGVLMDDMHRSTDLVAMLEGVRGDLPRLKATLMIDDMRAHIDQSPQLFDGPRPDPHDPALIVFTSGTTGKPKGAILTHQAIVNSARNSALVQEQQPQSVWLATLPVYHIGGSFIVPLGAFSRLGKVVTFPGFDAGLVLDLIETQRINWMAVVPAMVIALLEHPTFADRDLSSLNLLKTGGTTITPEFVRLASQALQVDVQVVLGQTEAGGDLTMTRRSDKAETIAATVGRPMPHTALKIVSRETDGTSRVGDIGEIRVRSPFMTTQYIGDEAATAALFDSEGYLKTGDLGFLDDEGYLHFTGRITDVIVRGGVNIYPREVEDALGEYPGITEVAVVGIPDAALGEEVAVAIKHSASPGTELDCSKIFDFMAGRVSWYKIPKHWILVPEFPRNNSGKIVRADLVEIFADDESVMEIRRASA